MSEPFIGQISMFAGNFAPRGYAFCDGQLLAVSSYDALFSLLGTMYGGDGRTTFGLPDLRGRVPIHYGTGPGLTPRNMGSKGGAEAVTLTVNQLPSHTHPLTASADPSTSPNSGQAVLGNSGAEEFYGTGGFSTPLSSNSVTSVGGSISHTNIQPFQCINFIIALVGIYPSRN